MERSQHHHPHLCRRERRLRRPLPGQRQRPRVHGLHRELLRTGRLQPPLVAHNIGDFANIAWRQPIPFDQTSNFGIALAYAGNTLWATTPFGVWSADIAAPLLDITPDILGFTLREAPFATEADIEIDNSTGAYNSLPVQLRLGSEVHLSPGYRIPGQAPAVAAGTRLYIAAHTYTANPNDQRLTLHCVGPWELLERWRARSSYQFPADDRNIFQLAQFILAKAGFDYTTITKTNQLTDLKPPFTIHPGETGKAALQRLLSKVADKVRFNLGSAWGVYPQTSDPTDHSYGAGHPILSLSTVSRAQDENYIHTLVDPILGEAIDWSSILLLYLRPEVEQEPSLNYEAEAIARATDRLRLAQVAAESGALTVPMNVGQQLYDVIAITSPA